MTTPSSSAASCPAKGRVEAVFEIRNRGIVVAVTAPEGVVHVGDMTELGGITARVAGIEMISRRDPAAPRPSSTGLLLTGIDRATAQASIGAQIDFHPGEAL